LLLAIIDTPKVREILRACGADATRLRKELKEFVDQTTPRLKQDDDREVQPTLGFQRVLQRGGISRAIERQEGSFRRQRAGRDLQREAFARGISAWIAEISRLDVVNFISHGLSKSEERDQPQRAEDSTQVEAEREGEGASVLEKYATNLNKLAQEGRIDPLIGRKLEIERTVEILCRRRKNNPLLRRRGRRGQDRPGEGLARLIVEGQGARRAGRQHGLFARPRVADCRHQGIAATSRSA
jgi:ATP-dependent Clp protease ATP-binding subunit ClpA